MVNGRKIKFNGETNLLGLSEFWADIAVAGFFFLRGQTATSSLLPVALKATKPSLNIQRNMKEMQLKEECNSNHSASERQTVNQKLCAIKVIPQKRKSCHTIFLKLPWMLPNNPCFGNYNKKEMSPCLLNRYNRPILPHWCLYWY